MIGLLLCVIYLSFISLGLPDSLLGAAWPTIYPQFGVPVSYAGILSFVISLGTIISALMSDRITYKIGSGKVTAFSVGLTAAALLGFSLSGNFWLLVLFAIPYGLGAGGVDAALNNYVAIHYASHHMSWLHCMWGIGASISPSIMSFALTHNHDWHMGYRYISILQLILTTIIIFSLPLWKDRQIVGSMPERSQMEGDREKGGEDKRLKPLKFRQIFSIRGASEIMVMFFCYCALETTAGMWASSYMALTKGIERSTAAQWASFFYIGITIGRAVSGFLTMRFNDPTMIRIGEGLLILGALILMIPFPGTDSSLVGLITVGLGCAPIYPCVIHATPKYFGADKSQAIIGVQMACAYTGTLAVPPVFGLITKSCGAAVFPFFLLIFILIMTLMHEIVRRKTGVIFD